MEYLNKYIERISLLQDYAVGRVCQNIELFFYSALCFFMPFFIGHPQFIVGTAVNAAIVLAALNLKGYRILPVIMLPSLGVLSRGIVFGPFTIFLAYMIPFVWVGNAILALSFKHFRLEMKKSYAFTLAFGAFAKALFLFASAFVLYEIGIVPSALVIAMGPLQLATALSGGALAYAVQAAKKKFY